MLSTCVQNVSKGSLMRQVYQHEPCVECSNKQWAPRQPISKEKTSQFLTNHEENDYQLIVDKSDRISQRNFHIPSTLWITNLTHAKSHAYMGHHVFLSAEYTQYSKVVRCDTPQLLLIDYFLS